MILPRRHRRLLLFPPGLLALAWVLLLGCGVVSWNTEQFNRHAILQLIMPPQQPEPRFARQPPLAARLPNELSVAELEGFRPWQTITFTGNLWQDYFSFRMAQTISWQLHDDPYRDRGVRIRFTDHATYANLVRMLNQLNVAAIPKYWLDIRHEPTTLYAFTARIHHQEFSPCGGLAVTEHYDTYHPETSWQQLKEYFSALVSPATYSPLAHPDWRLPVYLLLTLAGFSGIQLGRQWRRA